jgi:hypothetical protein
VRCVGDWPASGVGRLARIRPARAADWRTATTGPVVLVFERLVLRGCGPRVPVVEATYSTMGVYGGGACRAQVHGTNHRCVLVDPEMRPIPLVVRQVLAEQPPKMLVVENDDLVEQIAPYGPHESFRHPVLPWALVARPRGLEPHRLDRGDRRCGEDRVPIEHQVSRAAARVIEGEMRSETLSPSFSSSPWIRGAPHPFSRAIIRTRSRTSRPTAARPATFSVWRATSSRGRSPPGASQSPSLASL